ncbi:MAG TPA: TldD/PmbA family protein [Gemmatimonadaceae bacterium]|nr:TldD/PmbA family protein [Gemmatimonadaceae bacterium]
MSAAGFSRGAPKRLLDAVETAIPTGAVMPRDQAQALVEKVVKMSKADAVTVSVNSGYQADIRFAANQVSTSGGVVNGQVAVQSTFGKRHAATTTNDFSDESLRRAVEQSEALAKLSPEDPETMPELGPQTYVPVNGYFESTANLSPEDRARAALTALDPARKAGDLKAAGFIVVNAGASALGNKSGLFAYDRNTTANYTLTVRTDDGTGSGWAGAEHPDWNKVDFAAVSARAIDKARLSRNPVAIEPGRYTVILEPQAVGDLVQLMAFALAARSADEGRSAFAKQGGGNKIGEKIVDPRVTIISDPQDPQLLSQPFDGQGLPLGRQVWVENGVLKQLFYSRFWAQKQGKQATGFPSSVKMMGGNTSVDDMIKSTPRGVLVTRLWYLRQVDPRTILYTGLTRDGTFLIENGKISKAIKNFRFNESPLFLLSNLEAIGPAVRLAGTEAGGAVVMPAIKAKDFDFTSLSDAV